jgi:hypothetical protein
MEKRGKELPIKTPFGEALQIFLAGKFGGDFE